MFSHIVFLLLTIQYSRSDCVLSEITREDAWDKMVHRDKLKNYNSRHPPQSCVPVKVKLMLKSFAFDEYEGRFTAKVWSRLMWKDKRLAWSTGDYGGVSSIIVRDLDIWTPSLKLLNSVYPNLFYVEYGDCLLKYDGTIVCVPQLVYDSFCTAKLSDWPYDVQNCTLDFGDEDIFGVSRFSFDGRAMSTYSAEFGTGWNIMAMSSEELNGDKQLSVTLTLERQAYGLVVVMVVPCIILSILTFTPTLLNVSDTIRLGLLCFSLTSHFIFLTTIYEFLPKHSGDTPVIILFFRDSTILTLISVLFTYILSKIVCRKTVPYNWISLVSSKLFNSFTRYVIFPRWKIIEIENVDVKNVEVWTNFANILNSVYIFIVIIVYISLFCVYMPNQPPAKY